MKYQAAEALRWHLQRRSRLIGVPGLILFFFVLSAHAQPALTSASNPVVIPSGQTSGSTIITWKAAPDYTYSEIYLSVDNGQWSEFARGRDDSKPATLNLGSVYTFRMMVYAGQAGTPTVAATLTITTVQGAPPSGSSIGDIIRSPVSKSKDSSPILRNLLAITNVRVEPGPRHIFIRFHGPPNQVPYVAIGRGEAIKGKDGEWVFGDSLVGGGFVAATVTAAEKASGDYTFASAFGTTFSEEGLDPGRTYYYIITIPAKSGRPYQDTGSFVMRQLTTTVRVVWEKILIVDDSDDLSTGEAQFWFWANYGQPGGETFHYNNGDIDTGHTYDLSRTIVVENSSNILTLSASGLDNDVTFSKEIPETEPPLSGPKNSSNDDGNVASGQFNLGQYGDNQTVQFTLNSMPGGSLKFVVSGHFEVTRQTAERTGTTSSALTSAPPSAPAPLPQEPVKVLGRVKTSQPLDSPARPICEVAREARERHSPAAPSLEAQCRAAGDGSVLDVNALAARGAAVADQDPLAVELRNQQPDDSMRRGFDVGMGAAEGQTLPGPGKEKIRSSLSQTEQRGFDAAVSFSLERNRNADLAARGAAIATADPTVAKARMAEADVFYQLGFDIASGLFGDPALGALGNTATGPGSLGIRNSLSPDGQRGFDDSLKLHLSRDYGRASSGGRSAAASGARGGLLERRSDKAKIIETDLPSDEIRCRGYSRPGGSEYVFFTIDSRPSPTGETLVTYEIAFTPSLQAAGTRGEGLRPGECAWVDRPISEPLRIRFKTVANAQLKQGLHGSQVDRSPTAAESYPDVNTIPLYLKGETHYWSFVGVTDSGRGFFQATGHSYWKPPAGIRDVIKNPTAPARTKGRDSVLLPTQP